MTRIRSKGQTISGPVNFVQGKKSKIGWRKNESVSKPHVIIYIKTDSPLSKPGKNDSPIESKNFKNVC